MNQPRYIGLRTIRIAGMGIVLAGVLATLAGEPASPARIAQLVRQLGDPDFQKREQASQELEAVGEPALPLLRKAAQTSNDAEIRHRAYAIARAVLWGARKSQFLGMEMIPVSTGRFTMGSPQREAGRQADEKEHAVAIARPFLLGVHEVTQEEYRKVMKTNPSWFAATGGGKDKVTGRDTARFPVENVTWFDAVSFCNELSQRDEFPAYYKLENPAYDGKSIIGADVTMIGGNGYRLPTEAEWEFACRANTTTPYHFGYVRTGKEANFKTVISGGYGAQDTRVHIGLTTPVGSYKPNNWTLYDMHGNVGEWCADWYDRGYADDALQTNPIGPNKGTHRVIRGGSWLVSYQNGRSASRYWLLPGEPKDHVGFRVARSP